MARVFSLSIQFVFNFAVMTFLSVAQAAPLTFNVDGMITKPDGNPLEEAGVVFQIDIRSPSSNGNCLLYREQSVVSMAGSNGYFSIPVGKGTNSAAGVYSLDRVLGNDSVLSGLSGCNTGSTYTPTADEDRQVVISFTDSTGAHSFTTQEIKAVPFAIKAKDATTVGGYAANALLKTSAAVTQANVESVFTRYSILDAILNGTFAGNATTATALASAPGACPAGQYMTAMTATGSITCGTPSAATGTVSNITSSNAYLTVANGTSTPALTVNVGTTANTLAAGDDARFTNSRAPSGTAGGDLSGTYPNPSVAKIAGKSIVLTAPASGEFLKYDGTNFVNSTVSTLDATKLPLAGGTMAGAIEMSTQNLTNVGFMTMSPNKSLHLSNNSSDPLGLQAADKGKIWYNNTTGAVKYWDGSSAQTLGVAGSGLSNLNGQTGISQSFAVGTSGATPAWSSGVNIHTLNIPMASTASVSAGLISKTEFDIFNAKLGTATAFTGDVSGTYNATSVDKIKGKAVSGTSYAAGQTLRYDGTGWVNKALDFTDLGVKPSTLAGYGITDGVSNTLAQGKILVGNGSNVATAVSLTGDAVLSNSGALTLATVPISKGGTGLTSFVSDKLISTTPSGAIQTTSCGLNQVISFTAGGNITCANVSTLAGSYVNGGNSFGAIASIGTNDPFSLDLKTNNSTRLSILPNGRVGIGTTSPAAALDVEGDIITSSAFIQKGTAAPSVSALGHGSIYFDSTSNKFKISQNGGAYIDLVDGAGNLSFAGSPSVNAFPDWTSSGTTHTLNMPMASTAGVTAGLLSKTDYEAFKARLATNTAFNGDVTGTYTTTSVDKIKGQAFTVNGSYAAGQVMRHTGAAGWQNSTLAFADLSGKPTTISSYGITDAISNVLPSGKILIGNGSNVASPVTVSGDATLDNAGTLTLATVPITKGGTGLTSFTADRIVTTNATGSMETRTCATGQVLSFTASGTIMCSNLVAPTGGFVDGGNTFTANATLGTESAHSLNLETNGSTRMTITSDGKVGIGTLAPGASALVEVNSNSLGSSVGAVKFESTSGVAAPTATFLNNGAGAAASFGNLGSGNAASFSGGVVFNSANLTVNGNITANSSRQVAATNINAAASYPISDFSKNIHRVTLAASSVFIELPDPALLTANSSFTMTVRVKQDSTGNRILNWISSGAGTLTWEGASPSTEVEPNPASNSVTIYQFVLIGGESVWYASRIWRSN